MKAKDFSLNTTGNADETNRVPCPPSQGTREACVSKIVLRPDRLPELEPSLDEIVVQNVAWVHFERMDDNHYWVGIDCADGRHIRVGIHTKRATIRMFAEVEQEGDAPKPCWGFEGGGHLIDEFSKPTDEARPPKGDRG